MPSTETCANLHLSFGYILRGIILLIILPKQKEQSDGVIFTKRSSSFSVSLCSQLYCMKNGDMRSTVSLFVFGYYAPHEAPQDERSPVWEEYKTSVFLAPFNHVFQEVPGLQTPMNNFYCLGIPSGFLKASVLVII